MQPFFGQLYDWAFPSCHQATEAQGLISRNYFQHRSWIEWQNPNRQSYFCSFLTYAATELKNLCVNVKFFRLPLERNERNLQPPVHQLCIRHTNHCSLTENLFTVKTAVSIDKSTFPVRHFAMKMSLNHLNWILCKQWTHELAVHVVVWRGSKQTEKNQHDFTVWSEPTFNFTSNRGPRPIQREEPTVTEQLSQWKRADK